MRPPIKIRAAAIALVVVAVGITSWLGLAHYRIFKAGVALSERRNALERELLEIEAELADASRKPAAKPAEAPVTLKTAPVAAPAATVRPYGVDAALRDDPAVQVLYLKSEPWKIRGQYEELFLRLKLSPEQIAAFTRNLLRRREQQMDLNAVADGRDPLDRKAVATLREQAENEYLDAQRAVLGDAGLKELQTYDRMAQPREIVANLAGVLATMDLPLSPQQGSELAALMGNTVDLSRSRSRIDLSYADWPAIDLAAAAILSAPQLEVFRTTLPAFGGRSRFHAEFSAAILSAYEREVPENARRPASK